jgi:hypothetical protein
MVLAISAKRLWSGNDRQHDAWPVYVDAEFKDERGQ